MTTTKNRNAARSVAVAATMFLGLSVSTAFAQEAQSVDPAEISAMTADFTLATTAFLADEIAQPSSVIEARYADLEDRTTAKPDYAFYQGEDGDETAEVRVASAD